MSQGPVDFILDVIQKWMKIKDFFKGYAEIVIEGNSPHFFIN